MSRRRGNQVIAGVLLAGLLAVFYLAFAPNLPTESPYRVRALVESSNQLRGGAPVRIAGVDVGQVRGTEEGPGHTTILELEIDDAVRPLRTDATLRIRPRLFLEGGFYVELSPGTPAAEELPDDGLLPLAQSSTPVQFHQLLSVFEQPVRESLRGGVSALEEGLSDGGAEGLRAAAPNLAPLLRDVAIVAEAAQGTEPDDVSALIRSASRVTAALAADRRALADLVTKLRVTAEALSADDTALAESIAELDGLIRQAPAGLRALDAALPVAERFATGVHPAVRAAPAALGETADVLAELGALVAPARRARTISGLRTTFLDLPTAVARMSELFPTIKGLSDCLRTHIIPTFNTVVDDGALSSGRPVWQDFAHSLVGLTSATQNFDANGYATRYLFGGSAEGFATDTIPGVGQLFGTADGPLLSRPGPPPEGAPPINRDVECTTQALPDFSTPAVQG